MRPQTLPNDNGTVTAHRTTTSHTWVFTFTFWWVAGKLARTYGLRMRSEKIVGVTDEDITGNPNVRPTPTQAAQWIAYRVDQL